MNKNRLWLLTLILIAWALRLTRLGAQSLWYDEGVTWMLSQMQLPDLINWTAADIQPPLYYLLIWITNIIFSDSEWALRFPSVIFSVLTVPLIYTLARRLFTAPSLPRLPIPLLAAALFTLSPLMIYYSQEARMYTLLTFEATLASYLLLKILHPTKPSSLSSLLAPPRSSSLLPPPFSLLAPPSSLLPPRSSLLAPPSSLLPPRSSLLYALTMTAALYTHYFAIFLLIAHALYALFIWWQHRFPTAMLSHLLVSFGGVLLLFVPWLPTLLSRLSDDPSYWPGALKLDEALRKLLISFTVGETVFEQTGWWLAQGYLAVLITCGVWIIANWRIGESARWRTPPKTRKRRANVANGKTIHRSSLIAFRSSRITHHFPFLLLWLLLPIFLILILSYQSPKFNPRYTLLAWPAFALILAASLAGFQVSGFRFQVSSFKSPGLWVYVLRFTFFLFILATALFSLYNWFTDPRFSKDDFKALAQFVRERQAPDETVLLSSGHMFPVWAYYYGRENWTPLPQLLRLDVNRVTDLSIATDIAEAIEGKEGVWLVTWQNEVIDPNGVVPFWLDLIGQRPDDAGDFWGVGLEHWRLDPGKTELLSQDPIEQATTINFANQLDLLGMTQLSNTEVVLFWRPRRPLPDDLTMTLDLTDDDGFDWDHETTIGRPGSYLYPPSRWPVGQIVMTHHQFPWQIGTPPGLYIAEIGLGTIGGRADAATSANTATEFTGWDILDEQGRPRRRTALIESVNLSHLVRPESGPLPLDPDPLVDFLPIIALRRSILSQDTAQPGDRVLLMLRWQAGEPNLDDISIAFDLIDAEGQTHHVGSSPTPGRHFSLSRWQPGDTVLGQYWLDIPPTTVPGPATLQLHIINVTAPFYDEVFPFDEIEILPAERNFTLPDAVDIPLKANFSDQITLIGMDCPQSTCSAAPGQTINLTLYWRTETAPDTNYTVFTHLLDSAETVLANADHAPPKPTQGWVPGEIITDPVILTIPTDLPPGDYALEVGLYNAADSTFPRLPLTTGETRVILPRPLVIE